MNPLAFTIQAWEKEIEMHKERKPLARLLTDLLPIRAKEAPAARPAAADCTTAQEPVSACCD
jgi:hypothetical protein